MAGPSLLRTPQVALQCTALCSSCTAPLRFVVFIGEEAVKVFSLVLPMPQVNGQLCEPLYQAVLIPRLVILIVLDLLVYYNTESKFVTFDYD